MSYFNPVLRFAVMSDVHFEKKDDRADKRFKPMLNSLYNYCHGCGGTLDALILPGDVVSFGLPEQYELMKANLAAVLPETQVVAVMGNHELMESFKNGCTFLPVKTACKNFTDAFGYDSIDRHEVIKGFHFIGSSLLYLEGGNYAFDLDRNTEWLREQTAMAAADGKPVFTFQHFPEGDTVVGSDKRVCFYYNVPRSERVFRDYPQVINFNGHSHDMLNNPNFIYQDSYTIITAGCLIFSAPSDYGKVRGNFYTPMAQCLLVEVGDNNEVRVRRYNGLTDSFIGDDAVIDGFTRQSFRYTPEKLAAAYSLPYFKDQAKITFGDVSDGKRSFSFPVGESPCPYIYRCELWNSGELKEYWKHIPRDIRGNSLEIIESYINLPAEGTLRVFLTDSLGRDSLPLEAEL